MRGVLRPCRHRLGPALHQQWLGHLCGLCLTLRDTAGQSARVLTGYDVLLVSVLVEAQAGRQPRQSAAPCPLRGFRPAQVVDQRTPAMREAAAAALLSGAGTLRDKLDDGDLPRWSRPIAAASVGRLTRAGFAAAGDADPAAVLAAAARARTVESDPGASLHDLLAPSGAVVGALLAATAATAGLPANEPALRTIGDALGRIIHLCDAADDRLADRRRDRFNPLEATATSDTEAAALARDLHRLVLGALDELQLVDGGLTRALLGPTLGAALDRRFGPAGATPAGAGPAARRQRPERPRMAAMAAVATLASSLACGRWRRRPYDGYGPDPYGGYGYGPGPYRRGCGGMSCGELLACDCCANCLCNDCCGGDDDCCCCVI